MGSRSLRPAPSTSRPGASLGSVSGELGLRGFLEARGHELIVTPDKDGPDSEFERQARYAAGTREILEHFLDGSPIRDEYLIVGGGNSQAPERTRTRPARA